MCGSRILEGYIPDVDAIVVSRILDAGGCILGKAVCESLCSSGGSFTSATGPVLHPDDPTRMTGGSSSGCAALVRSCFLKFCRYISSSSSGSSHPSVLDDYGFSLWSRWSCGRQPPL